MSVIASAAPRGFDWTEPIVSTQTIQLHDMGDGWVASTTVNEAGLLAPLATGKCASGRDALVRMADALAILRSG